MKKTPEGCRRPGLKKNYAKKFKITLKMERQNKQPSAKRQELKALSNAVKPLVQAGEYDSVNAALIGTYTSEKHTEFKSFRRWQAEGMQVKKSEKAFLLWAKPKPIGKKEQAEETDEQEDEFFPVAYLFSNAQVTARKGERSNG